MNTEEALRAAIEILESHGCKYWLMAGTCLGAVRDKRFLNVDIDIGISSDHLHLWDQFIEDFKAMGFDLFMEWKDGEEKIELSFTSKEETTLLAKIDLFFFFVNGEYCWHGLFGPDKEGRYGEHKIFYPCVFKKKLFLNLKEINFRGIKCYVPNPPEEYLECWYGNTWDVPTRDWISWRDSQAINFGAWKWMEA